MRQPDRPLLIPWQGGLGNQLFELSAGLVTTARSGRPVVFTDDWLQHPAAGETARSFALHGLVGPTETASTPVMRGLRRTDIWSRRRVVEGLSDDDALARVRTGTRVLQGYFQRLDYVAEAWPALRQRLAGSQVRAHRELVRERSSDIGTLHYRLGDYLSNPGAQRHHGATAPAYYRDVIRHEAETTGISRWQVVSDQPAAALDLLRSCDLPPGIELSTAQSSDDWSDLVALASARVCVIANSSFSWWAGYVAEKVGGTRVVAPRPWFAAASTPEPALFPDSWVRRERPLLGA